MDFKRRAAFLWRWAWLIILGTAVAGGVAYITSQNSVPIYQSSTQMLVKPAPASDLENAQSARTYAEILQTEPIRQEIIDQLELPINSAQLAKMIAISVPEGTQIIHINVSDVAPDRAALIANALGQTLIDQNQSWASQRYAQPIANWQGRLEEIDDEIQAINKQISDMGQAETNADQEALSRLERQLENAQTRYADAFSQFNESHVTQAQETDTIIQIEEAKPNHSATFPRTAVNTILAAFIGAIAATGIAILASRSASINENEPA